MNKNVWKKIYDACGEANIPEIRRRYLFFIPFLLFYAAGSVSIFLFLSNPDRIKKTFSIYQAAGAGLFFSFFSSIILAGFLFLWVKLLQNLIPNIYMSLTLFVVLLIIFSFNLAISVINPLNLFLSTVFFALFPMYFSGWLILKLSRRRNRKAVKPA